METFTMIVIEVTGTNEIIYTAHKRLKNHAQWSPSPYLIQTRDTISPNRSS